jgi:hypothetical protein
VIPFNRDGDLQLDSRAEYHTDGLVRVRRRGPVLGEDEEIPTIDEGVRISFPVQKVGKPISQLETKVGVIVYFQFALLLL